MLPRAVFDPFLRMPADGGGIKEDLRAAQRREPSCLGVPLVPAYTNSNAGEFRIPSLETQISRSEVELLVKKRIIRDVHLAVLPEIGSVSVDDCRGIVIDSRRAALEKRSNDYDVELFGDRLHPFGCRSGNGLGQLEIFVIFDLAKVDRAKKLLQANYPRAPPGGLANAAFGRRKIRIEARGAPALNDTNLYPVLRHASNLATIPDMKKTLFALFAVTICSVTATNAGDMPDIRIIVKTSKGDIEGTLFPSKTPVTVANFLNLANRGYYDGVTFHRVIPNFMIQGGDPTGTGRGGPGYTFEDEFRPDLKHDKAGVFSMANTGRPVSNGSQFFVTHVPTPWLDGKHTVFGEVTKGQDVVNAIGQGDKILKIEILDSPDTLFETQKARISQWDAALKK
jgi:peptidyl-prolyl cis-trans isomerase B (cyclophilin B)